MADQEQIPPEPENRDEATEQGSVFGKLPGSRPGVRSPRRGAAGGAKAGGGGAKGTGGQSRGPAHQQKPAEPRSRRPAEPRSPREPVSRPVERPAETEPATTPAAPEHGGVDDLAWAGIAVAAEAATLGVRLLSRAVDAVRKPSDRR